MEGSNIQKNLFWKFLVSRKFFINLSIAILVLIILFFLLLKSLDIFTRHGKNLIVPDFYGKTIEQIDSLGYTKEFDFFVIDSLFDEDCHKGSVVIQEPEPGIKVKKGRNIYITIVATMPETVVMPDLKDLTLRQAINILESAKLKAGRLIYSPSFDKNAVLEQMFMGDTIHPGDTLIKESAIDLVIGTGERQYKIPIPFLLGKTRDEAIYDLNIASFNLGNEFNMDSIMDENVRVYMQEPHWESKLAYYPGDSIHIWYRSIDSIDFNKYLMQFLPDSLQVDSLQMDINGEF